MAINVFARLYLEIALHTSCGNACGDHDMTFLCVKWKAGDIEAAEEAEAVGDGPQDGATVEDAQPVRILPILLTEIICTAKRTIVVSTVGISERGTSVPYSGCIIHRRS